MKQMMKLGIIVGAMVIIQAFVIGMPQDALAWWTTNPDGSKTCIVTPCPLPVGTSCVPAAGCTPGPSNMARPGSTIHPGGHEPDFWFRFNPVLYPLKQPVSASPQIQK